MVKRSRSSQKDLLVGGFDLERPRFDPLKTTKDPPVTTNDPGKNDK
jgi:hypothetical protein